MSTQQEPIRIKDAAQLTGASPSGIRKYVQTGEIPSEQEKTNTGYRYMVTEEGLKAIRDLLRNGRIRPSRNSGKPARTEAEVVVATQEPQRVQAGDGAAAELLRLRVENDRLRELLAIESERRREAAERALADRSLLERALAGRLALPPHEEEAKPPARTWLQRVFGR